MDLQQAQARLLQQRKNQEGEDLIGHNGKSLTTIGGDYMEKLKQRMSAPVTASEDKAKHERAYWVELTRKALGKQLNGKPYTFGRILGMTRTWSIPTIRDRYYYCEKYSGGNFAKVWFGIRKKEKENAKIAA